tara:strand:- start:556 stop:843 length:288 start_codon:yes stop_codon:yes gene_type:complete
MGGCNELLAETFKNLVRKEKFNGNDVNGVVNGAVNGSYDMVYVLIDIIALLIVLMLVSLLGSYLWNNSVLVLFKGANKARWIDILKLSILIKLML